MRRHARLGEVPNTEERAAARQHASTPVYDTPEIGGSNLGYLSLVRTLSDLYHRSRKPTTEDGWLAARFVFRPLSFAVAPVFIFARISANQITLLNVVLVALCVGIFASGSPAALVTASMLFFLFTVLDYVDGNVSRYQGTSSLYGKMIDGAVDAVGFLHFAAAALGNTRAGTSILPGSVEIGLGFATFALALFFSYFEMRLMYFRSEARALNAHAATAAPTGGRRGRLRWLKEAYLNALIASPAVLPVFAVFDAISLYILFYFLLHALYVPANIAYSLHRARSELSNSDPRANKADTKSGNPVAR